MAEYIEREAVVMGILGLAIVDPMVAQYADAVLHQIQQAPAADVVPVVHGRWIEDGYFDYPCVCSICGTPTDEEFRTRYCPNCGAKMDGDT